MKTLLWSMLLGLGLSVVAEASTFVITDDELDAKIFPAVADSIRANIDGPDAPPGLTAARKADVLRSLDQLEALLLDDSTGVNRERARGLQARINTHLLPQVARNDASSEVVCRRIKKVGTNIPITQCRTRAEIEHERMMSQDVPDQLRQLQSLEQCPPGATVC